MRLRRRRGGANDRHPAFGSAHPSAGRAALPPVRYRRIFGACGRRDQPARPDVAVVTGDLVDHGEPPEYEHLRALLAPLAMPVFVIPGNHDAREPLRAAFAADGYLPTDGFLQYAIEDYSVRLIGLDTLIPGQGGGLLCAEQLAWLDHALA